MTARILSFTNEVREAARDARSLRLKTRDEGHEWTAALAKANARMIELASNIEGLSCDDGQEPSG